MWVYPKSWTSSETLSFDLALEELGDLKEQYHERLDCLVRGKQYRTKVGFSEVAESIQTNKLQFLKAFDNLNELLNEINKTSRDEST